MMNFAKPALPLAAWIAASVASAEIWQVPGSLALFASGLIALGVFSRRRTSRKA